MKQRTLAMAMGAGSPAGQSVHNRSGRDLYDEGQPGGRTGLLQQLSHRQRKLRNRRRASDSGVSQPGECSRP